MLIIRPIQTKDEQKRLCEIFGTAFVPEALAYSAFDDETDGGIIIGLCQFTITGGRGELLDLLCEAEDASIIMGRAAVSFMGNIGISECVMKRGIVDDMLAKRLGFSGDVDVLHASTTAHPCGDK